MKRNRYMAGLMAVVLVLLNAVPALAQDTRSYAYQWTEGKMTTVDFWNHSSRVALEYAQNPWPQAQFAAQRAYLNAARIVMRDGIRMTDVINSLGRSGTIRVHGAEANGPNDHHDYPVHMHLFYLNVSSSGAWTHTNSHAYLDSQGKVHELFVIPQICSGGAAYRQPAEQWLDVKDETCTAIWQQRFTTGGDFEIRRNSSGPTYTLRTKSITGDLASVDILENGQLRWNVSTTEYSGTSLRLVARITDHQRGTAVIETWQGDMASRNMLTSHTTVAASGTTPAPAPTVMVTQVYLPITMASATAPASTAPAATITKAIDAFDDDGYQDGTAYTNDTTTVWVGDNNDANASFAGLRFADVTVPHGATIQSASLRLYSTAASSAALRVNIYGAASGNPSKFSATSLPASRALTSAYVGYNNPSAWAANTWYSIDVSSVVRELVNRSDWASGNAMGLLLKGTSGSQGVRRGVRGNTSWDHNSVPQLVIQYGSGSAPPPTVAPTLTPAPGTAVPTRTSAPPTATTAPVGNAYYVATNGNDSNPGTETLPWRTIAKAASTLTAGRTVYVKNGTYNERLVPARSGTAGSPITFAAYPGHAPVLEGSGLTVGGYAGLVDLSSRSYLVVDGFRVQNSSGVGIFAQNAQQITIKRNHTFHSNGSGIGIWGSRDVIIDGNDVENSNYNGSQEALSLAGTGPFEIRYNRVHNPAATSAAPLKEGIDAKQGAHDGKIHHNEVYDMQKVALYVDAYDIHTYNIDVYANAIHDVRMGITLGAEHGGLLEQIKVYNNTIWNVFYSGIRTFGLVDGYPTHQMGNIQYLYNTIYNCGTGINVGNDQLVGPFVVANNLLVQNTTTIDLAAASMVTQAGNLVTSSPLFVNASSGDFHLTSGSPAIGRASTSYVVSTDMDATARPQGGSYDVGAYEFR